MTIDPRLAERRRVVAEDRARRNIGRLLKFIVIVSVIGAVVWLALSPALSVKEVWTAGIVQSSTHAVLSGEGVRAGTPMVLIRASRIEEALLEDPWIAQATVELDWPGTVIVRVVERTPVAWVETRGGWARRALDGVALPSPRAPDGSLGWVRLPDVIENEASSAPEVLGAIEFIAALPAELGSEATVREEGDGEIWAQVGGYQIRLGRPVEMTAKALSLTALLREKPDLGSILTLVAPSHPAVTPAGFSTGPEEELESEESGQP